MNEKVERVLNAWNNFVKEIDKEGYEKLKEMIGEIGIDVINKLDLARAQEPPDDVQDIPTELSEKYFMTTADGGTRVYVVEVEGKTQKFASTFYSRVLGDYLAARRCFAAKEYAEMFREQTQFIADCLHFKYLYDREYKPDKNDCPFKKKWRVCYNNEVGRFGIEWDTDTDAMTVYFSTEYLASKCAEWLNLMYKCGKYSEGNDE